MKQLLTTVSACLAFVASAQAHPTGHQGGFFETARHFLSEPDHILMLVSALALVAVVATLAVKQVRASKK